MQKYERRTLSQAQTFGSGSNYRRLRSGVNPTRNIVIADRATLLRAFGYNSLDCLASILAANQKGQYAESNPLPLV